MMIADVDDALISAGADDARDAAKAIAAHNFAKATDNPARFGMFVCGNRLNVTSCLVVLAERNRDPIRRWLVRPKVDRTGDGLQVDP